MYNESARLLTRVLEDKVISPSDSLFDEDGCKIVEGIYTIIAKNSESNPIYIKVKVSTDEKPTVNIQNITSFLVGKNLNNYDSTGVDSTKDGSTKVIFENIVAGVDSSEIREPNSKIPSPVKPTKESKLSLIAGAHTGQVSGVEAGIQYGQFAFLGEYNFSAADEHIETKYGKVTSTGMQSVRSLDNVDFHSLGVEAEYHLKNSFLKDFFVGAGAVHWSGKKQRSIGTQDIHTQQAIESPKYDLPEEVGEWSANVKAGYGRNISKNLKLEGYGKYNTKKGASVGARINYHF